MQRNPATGLSDLTKADSNGIFRVSLLPGYTLNIRTVINRMGEIQSLPGVEVYIGENRVGITDNFSLLNYDHDGKSDDLIEVILKSKDFYPKFLQDFYYFVLR